MRDSTRQVDQEMLHIPSQDLNKLIWKIFTRGRGLALTTEAVQRIVESVTDVPFDEIPAILDYIASTYSSTPSI